MRVRVGTGVGRFGDHLELGGLHRAVVVYALVLDTKTLLNGGCSRWYFGTRARRAELEDPCGPGTTR